VNAKAEVGTPTALYTRSTIRTDRPAPAPDSLTSKRFVPFRGAGLGLLNVGIFDGGGGCSAGRCEDFPRAKPGLKLRSCGRSALKGRNSKLVWAEPMERSGEERRREAESGGATRGARRLCVAGFGLAEVERRESRARATQGRESAGRVRKRKDRGGEAAALRRRSRRDDPAQPGDRTERARREPQPCPSATKPRPTQTPWEYERVRE